MLTLLLASVALAQDPSLVVPEGYDQTTLPAWHGAVAVLLGPAEVNGEAAPMGAPLYPGDKVAGVTTVLHANLTGAVVVGEGSTAKIRADAIWVDGRDAGMSSEGAAPAAYPVKVHLPRDNEAFTQQYDELGLPRTPAAWAWQSRIDGGALAAERDAILEAKTSLAVAALAGALGRTDAPTLAEVRAAIPAIDALAMAPGNRERLAASRLAPVGPKLHDTASPLCPSGEVLILSLFPTSTSKKSVLRGIPRAFGRTLTFRGPDLFRVSGTLGKIRVYDVALADSLWAAGCHVRAMPVPYANTAENVVLRRGEPWDGADNLHALLEQVPEGLDTVAVGFSQGAGALRLEIEDWSGLDGLDGAVILAPMGGADGAAGRGVYSGVHRGVRTITLMHTLDPAADIPVGAGLIKSRDALKNFGADPGVGGTRSSLHGYWYGSEDEPGVDPREGLNGGIYGYPIALVRPILDDFVAGLHDVPLARRGDWNPDLRELLVSPPGDLRTLKVDPATVAEGLRPVP